MGFITGWILLIALQLNAAYVAEKFAGPTRLGGWRDERSVHNFYLHMLFRYWNSHWAHEMTPAEIIEAAREAGWTGLYITWAEPSGKPDWSPAKESLTVPVTMEQIQRFAAIIEARQREKDAALCDGIAEKSDSGRSIARLCAAAIRGQE